jgi:hypothetical protein
VRATIDTPTGYTITDNSTRNAMDLTPLPNVGSNRSFSVVENSALELGPAGLLDGAADGDTVTPDPDVPIVDSGLIESPHHGQVTAINTSDGSFAYQPTAGYVGRDWFTYRLLDGSKPSDYATIFINMLPLNVSLAVGGLQPGDPAAVIPTVTSPLYSAPIVALNLNGVNGLPQGSTVTLSMNSDVVPDLTVSTLPPGTAGNVQIIGHDAGTNTYTWTVGTNSPPPYVWAAGLTGTDYDQVLFHLTVQVAPTITGTPTVPVPAASQPVVAAQPASVAGNGFLVAFDGTTDTAAKNTVIRQFYNAYDPGTTSLLNKDYEPGVGNADDNPNAFVRYWNVAFGDGAARAYEWSALFHVASYFAQHPGEPLDVIGYSRGAFEATLLLKDLSTNSARFKEVVKTMYRNKKGLAFPTTARFVGLVAPVSGALGDTFIEKWPTSVPGGVRGMYEGLAGKVFATENPILKQVAITKPDSPPPDEKTYSLDGHTTIQFDPQVLAKMEADAKLVGVKFK